MTIEEIETFVATYVRYLTWSRLPAGLPTSKAEAQAFIDQSSAHSANNPYADDADDLFHEIHHDPELAWQIIIKIISAVENNEGDLGMFGAGDLETFVHVQAVPFADQIEHAIRTNGAFRKAFESVYIGQSTPRDIGLRFNRALRDSGVAEESIIDWWGGDSADG